MSLIRHRILKQRTKEKEKEWSRGYGKRGLGEMERKGEGRGGKRKLPDKLGTEDCSREERRSVGERRKEREARRWEGEMI